jgi:outer membrane protein OmpA-like peptidoglycan-associated protein
MTAVSSEASGVSGARASGAAVVALLPLPPPELVSLEYSPSDGTLKAGDTCVITATVQYGKEPLKKKDSMTVFLNNGREITLCCASNVTYVGTYTVTGGSTSTLSKEMSILEEKMNNMDGSSSTPTTTTTTTTTTVAISSENELEQQEDTSNTVVVDELDELEDVANLQATSYYCGAVKKSGISVVNVAEFQPTGTILVATKAPELIRIEYQLLDLEIEHARWERENEIGASKRADGVLDIIREQENEEKAEEEDAFNYSTIILETGNAVKITATCTTGPVSPLAKGTTISVTLSNGKTIALNRASDTTFVGIYQIESGDATPELIAAKCDVGKATDEAGNDLLLFGLKSKAKRKVVPTSHIGAGAIIGMIEFQPKGTWVVSETKTKSENKPAAHTFSFSFPAIAGETKQQTLQRKASVQVGLKHALLGETLKWSFKLDSGIIIQEIEDAVATQGDAGAIGEFVDACDDETETISIYSNVDQKFNTEQDLVIGTTMIPATQLSSVNFVRLANNIIFETNTLIIMKGSNHVCRRIANILIANPDIRIRIDGHVKLSKKLGSRVQMHPAKIGQAERLSRLRAMSVRDKIAEYGVDADRLEYKGCGGNQPLSNDQDDKRVEIHVL